MTISFVFRFAIIIYLAACLSFVRASGQTMRVTLLGTGAPSPVMYRMGPSILVEAGGQKLIFDVGRGSLQRLTQVNVNYKDVQGVFFTHLHSDHIVGFPDLWLTGWITGAGRKNLLSVWGPAGTKKMMALLAQAFEFDIKLRISDDKAPPSGVLIEANDIKEGVIYEKNGVKVTAFNVDHRPIDPAFGYRIDFGGRSVVLSGDTRYSENLIKYARGVDLLVHEVASPEAMKRSGQTVERQKSVVAHHTTPERAGEVFAKVKPKLAVYSHIVPPFAEEASLIALTRKTFTGSLEVGQDLMVIEIGEKIEIRRTVRPEGSTGKTLSGK
ncbi:MAG: MBL fold metallo-hydrolase [Acidobacteriota bacterium]|nr:MBL fold metallo-hydrolase [Acidobacteriota bacterium]